MRRILLVFISLIVLAGVVVFSQRERIALRYAQRAPADGGLLAQLSFATLTTFPDRPEIEAFVRAQMSSAAMAAVRGEGHGVRVLDSGLLTEVYAAQPQRLDADVVADYFTVVCADDCFSGYGDVPPSLSVPPFLEAIQDAARYGAGLRTATIRLSKVRRERADYATDESFLALARTLAERGEQPDSELAAAIAARTYAGQAGEREVRWFDEAIRKIVGPEGSGDAWAHAIAASADAEPPFWTWNIAVDALFDASALSDASLRERLATVCAARSVEKVDQACVDLGLAGGRTWDETLNRVKAGASRTAPGARALLAAEATARTQTWHDVLAKWKATPTAPPAAYEKDAGIRVSPMASARSARKSREEVRQVAVVLAAGDQPVPELLQLYRVTKSWDILDDVATVLSQRASRQLAKLVTDEIPEIVPLARAFQRGEDYDRSEYDVRGLRVAYGLLRLEAHAASESRTTPLILALSIPDAEFSKHASATLRRLLTGDEFADALFRFLAQRESFAVEEVDAYRSTLISYDNVAPAITRNLQRLLDESGSQPEQVPWIQKLIGLSALGRVGDREAEPLLQKYAADTGSYKLMTTTINRIDQSKASTAEEKAFSDLARSAIEQIEARGG
jgi:hypothetical protein